MFCQNIEYWRNMKLSDFSSEEQKEIKEGLSEGVVDDKEAAKKILALVPEEYIKKIPFFVRSQVRPLKRLPRNILICMPMRRKKEKFLMSKKNN